MPLTAALAVALLAAVALFQAALALGAPFGKAAWGGQHPGVLSARLRIASGVAAVVVYPLVVLLVLAVAGVVEWGWTPGTARVVGWLLAGLFTVGALLNAISRSPAERWWAPASLGIAVCCAVLALSA